MLFPPGAPLRRGGVVFIKLSLVLSAVLIRCCRWQKGLTVSPSKHGKEHARLSFRALSSELRLTWLHVVLQCLPSRALSLLRCCALVTSTVIGSATQRRRGALPHGLPSERECCVRLSFQHCTPAADERAERYVAGARLRESMVVDASLVTKASSGAGELGVLHAGAWAAR